MKFAIKIPSDIFSDKMSDTSVKILESFGGEENLLEFCQEKLDGVEISMVRIDTDALVVRDAVKKCTEHNLNVTIHGKLNDAKDAESFFTPYMMVIKEKLLPVLNITVHPLATADETEDILIKICDYIEKNNYPVRITLENQRNKSDITAYAGCRGVCGIVKKINNPYLYLCFDFGHQLSNVRKDMKPYDEVTDGFISMVRHTHIHSYFEGVTHFPLCMGETLLEENISWLLDKGYDETLLLELDPKRYLSHIDIKESYEKSVEILKTAYKQCIDKRKELNEYKSYSSCVLPIADKIKNNTSGVGLLSPSTYIFKLDDTIVGIDPCLHLYDVDKEGEDILIELLNKCDAVIVTHKHRDHFDPLILDKISSDVPIYCPEFIDYKKDSVVTIKVQDMIKIKNLEIEFFESFHSTGETIVPEVGFCIIDNNDKYVFPIDVRDYQKDYPEFSNVKTLMAHLWLGRQNALNVIDNPYVDKFVRYVNSFHAKKVYVSHVYGVHRKIDDMWTDTHYNLIKDKIGESSLLRLGDWIDFD